MADKKVDSGDGDRLSSASSGSPKFLIIDTDCGVDDALALLIATSFPETRVLAITCCHGNVSLDLIAGNVFRVLRLNGKDGIPVFNGCNQPLVKPPKTDTAFHGVDGFGNVSHSYPIREEHDRVETEHAVQALIRLVSSHKHQVTLLVLGPMTNIAMAQRIDPEFSKNLQKLVFMGGNIFALGNIDISTEFNFHCDPEAAFVVLNEFSCPVVCVPWEPCLQASIPWNIYESLTSGDGVRARFLRDVSSLTANWIKSTGFGGYFPCDLFAALFLFHPEVASATERRFATVELRGSVTAGEMIVDFRSKTKNDPNMSVVLEFDKDVRYFRDGFYFEISRSWLKTCILIMSKGNRLIFDTDCGVDDALALMLALLSPDCRVEAITCCHGNTSVENVWKNVFRILVQCNKTEVPVYVGCECSLLGEKFAAKFHGADGFGNIAHTLPLSSDLKPQSEHASLAMIRYVEQNPGEITLVAVGPLTNLAVAQRMDPAFSKNLKNLVIMGGNVEGLGNALLASEYNFHCDPEAASVVLAEYECPKLCVPWETCYRSKIPWDEFARLISLDTNRAKFIKALTKHSADVMRGNGREGYRSCDLFALACFFNPEVAEVVEKRFATVELHGTHTRGQMVVERRPWGEGTPNLDIVMKINEKELSKTCERIFL